MQTLAISSRILLPAARSSIFAFRSDLIRSVSEFQSRTSTPRTTNVRGDGLSVSLNPFRV